jgi:hypothetical protein
MQYKFTYGSRPIFHYSIYSTCINETQTESGVEDVIYHNLLKPAYRINLQMHISHMKRTHCGKRWDHANTYCYLPLCHGTNDRNTFLSHAIFLLPLKFYIPVLFPAFISLHASKARSQPCRAFVLTHRNLESLDGFS